MDLELQPWPSNVSGEGIATKDMYTSVCRCSKPFVLFVSRRRTWYDSSKLENGPVLSIQCISRSVGSRVFADVMVNARGWNESFSQSHNTQGISDNRLSVSTVLRCCKTQPEHNFLLVISTCVLSSSFCRWL
jgi:hypothetical protein